MLVKVHAVSVNRTECGYRAAKPFFSRLFSGLTDEAYRYVETGGKIGNVVISFVPSSS